MIRNIMAILILVVSVTPAFGEANITDVEEFLINDTTNLHEKKVWYSCGHFTRDLARNGSECNISFGGAILSNNPVFMGKWNSHIINYIEINDTLLFIEPENDNLVLLEEVFAVYKYIRLYPDGTQVPSNWKYNLAPSLRYDSYQ